MAKRNNNAWLRKFMTNKKLTRPEVANAICVNLSTVDRWLLDPKKVSHRPMSNMARKLLTYMDDAGDFDSE